MIHTSTYEKHFFLEGKNLSFSNLFTSLSNELKTSQDTQLSEEFSSSKKAFNLTKNIVWVCSKCGHTHIGVSSPATCPICNSSYEINEQ
ncbi:MAG: hypothetical protein IJX99_03445 [Clostridia bacterium]|nr:hypothetical protein [Clostridia bacterium]